jgi:hypothetical protein
MPYLQLDTPFLYSIEAKQRLAKRLGEIYSQTMNSNINRLTVPLCGGLSDDWNPDEPDRLGT